MTFPQKFIAIFSILSFVSYSCSKTKETKQEVNSPITGSVKLIADEAFKPLIEAEKSTFQALYKNTEITIDYQPEQLALNQFLNDSVEMILIGRNLSEEENQFFKNQQTRINQIHIANDALAFLIPETFPFDKITDSVLIKICSGQYKKWNEINSTLPAEDIHLVIDQSQSSNLQFASRHFRLSPEKVKIYAAGSNTEVAEYIQKQPNAIGIIGTTWINDEESDQAKALRKGLKILEVEKNGQIYSPLQDKLAIPENPLSRPIYLIRKNKRTDLGTGFSSFLVSDKGQRIVLKLGILPSKMPGREIIIN